MYLLACHYLIAKQGCFFIVFLLVPEACWNDPVGIRCVLGFEKRKRPVKINSQGDFYSFITLSHFGFLKLYANGLGQMPYSHSIVPTGFGVRS
jgi:hypothetical protein